MEFLKDAAQLAWESSVKTAAALLVAQYFPVLLDRAKTALGVVGGKLAEFGWWMRESVPAA